MEYNKEGVVVKKDGRILKAGGPRDIQRRQELARMQTTSTDQGPIIDALRSEIASLKELLRERGNNVISGFTQDQVDAEVNKTVTEVSKDIELTYKQRLAEAKELFDAKIEAYIVKVKVLETKIAEQQELISYLKTIKPSSDNSELKDILIEQARKIEELAYAAGTSVLENGRPQMDDVVIDPLDSNSGSGLKSHIKVEDISITEKEDIKSKVGKLKNLLGSNAFPNKRP